MFYKRLSDKQLEKFQENINVISTVILNFVKHCCVVRPEEYDEGGKTKYEYKEFMKTKDMIVACIPRSSQKDLLQGVIVNIEAEDSQKVKLIMSKNFDISNWHDVTLDKAILERIINRENKDFKKKLPEALRIKNENLQNYLNNKQNVDFIINQFKKSQQSKQSMGV